MTIKNRFVLKGNSQHWIYSGGCAYAGVPESCHNGKVDKHHPVHWLKDATIPLCELHHSLLQGRKKRHWKELQVNKSLPEMKAEIEALQSEWFASANLREDDFDKH